MSQTKIIAVANQKGGVGKTSTTMNLGYALSEKGYKVLLVDLDPQHNLSNYLEEKEFSLTIAEAMEQELKGEAYYAEGLIKQYNENLYYIPTSLNLSVLDMALVTANAREYILSDIFEKLNVKEQFDYVLIDCMPALNILLINALTSADSVLIPVEASYGAFEGLGQLFHYIDLVKKRLNRQLRIEGILFTKTTRTKLTEEIRSKLKQDFPDLMFAQEIKELTEARQSYAERIPLSQMKKSRLAYDYALLADELVYVKGES